MIAGAITHLYHVTPTDTTRLALLLSVTGEVRNTSCGLAAILTLRPLLALSNCQLICYQKDKGDARSAALMMPLRHLKKSWLTTAVINAPEHKY